MSLHLIARCLRGLEWVLADEITDLPGSHDLLVSEREVAFSLDTAGADRDTALLWLRTADDLLLDVGSVGGVNHTRAGLAALPDRIARLDFRRALDSLSSLRDLPDRPAFDIVASLLGRRNYNRYAVEDAAGARIARMIGGRYLSRTPDRNATPGGGTPQTADSGLTIRLFLHGPDVHAALRIPARPLHRRDWKLATGPGTLHPPLAAALARLGVGAIAGSVRVADTGGVGATAIDPCCGDGTLPIELALLRPDLRIAAGDLDAQRLANAVGNAGRAGVLAARPGDEGPAYSGPPQDAPHLGIGFVRADAGRPAWRGAGADLVLTNPPWNRTVGAAGALAGSFDPLWDALPGLLAPGGRLCTVADVELGIEERLRDRGYGIALAQSVRLAGRVSLILLATPPGAAVARLAPGAARQRRRALTAGLITETGF